MTLHRTQDSARDNSLTIALGAALFALAVGFAVNINNGFYDRQALLWLTIGLAFLGLSLFAKRALVSSRALAQVLAAGIVVETALLLSHAKKEPLPLVAILIISVFGVVQLFSPHRVKLALIVAALAAFFYAGVFAINLPNPRVDVLDWQQQTSLALSEGRNPYLVRIAPRFPHDLRFYPPGVVDRNGYLNCALPYPPLSLLMVTPAFVVADDIRYAHLFAIAASALLMTLARPGRIAALAAMLFLLTPRVFYVLWAGWTEPLMVLNFSLLMFCACRWRKGLPWALGLFLATKQTAVWALPLLPLLVEGPERWRELRGILIKAGIVVAAINLPFLLWNTHEFVRAVVLLQVVPPFRTDALTYLVWIYSLTGKIPRTWIGAPVAGTAIALALWRAPRSPAGFAAGVTLVTTLFFAFSKQAFVNYYYFTIATACWAIAAAVPDVSSAEADSSREALGTRA